MLTKTERKVYKLYCENGYTFMELAHKLYLSQSTIKTHFDNICKKKKMFGCNRSEKLILDYWQRKVEKYKGYIKTLKEENNANQL